MCLPLPAQFYFRIEVPFAAAGTFPLVSCAPSGFGGNTSVPCSRAVSYTIKKAQLFNYLQFKTITNFFQGLLSLGFLGTIEQILNVKLKSL